MIPFLVTKSVTDFFGVIQFDSFLPLCPMKKLSFLLGSLGGVMAGYVFSNTKLRTELMKAKDTSAAAKILGRHLSADGQTVAKEVQQLAEQHHMDKHVADGKKYVQKYYKTAKDEVQKFITTKVKEVGTKTKAASKSSSSKKKR